MNALLRMLCLYLRTIERLCKAIPDNDPIRRRTEWRQFARQTAFLAHFAEDAEKRAAERAEFVSERDSRIREEVAP